jgi:hypothetical protein
MRKALGILGISLPFILIIGSLINGGCHEIQSSISAYYYTSMRNVFEGVLCCMALFLFSYKGYDYIDNLAGNLGCIAALGVAFFPCGPDDTTLYRCQLVSTFHYVFALLFFAVMIFFSVCLFTKSYIIDKEWKNEGNEQKRYRNIVYWVCGSVIFLSILCIPFIKYVVKLKTNCPYEFWLESVALIFFGISWLTKGQMILKDIHIVKEPGT